VAIFPSPQMAFKVPSCSSFSNVLVTHPYMYACSVSYLQMSLQNQIKIYWWW